MKSAIARQATIQARHNGRSAGRGRNRRRGGRPPGGPAPQLNERSLHVGRWSSSSSFVPEKMKILVVSRDEGKHAGVTRSRLTSGMIDGWYCFSLCFSHGRLYWILKMGRSRRKTKWRVAAISQRDVQQAEDLLTELPVRSPSFVRRFLDFLTLNNEMSSASVLAGFVGQLANCRLKWTSIAVYPKQAVDFLRGQDAILPSDRMTISRLQKAVHLRAADCDLRQVAAADVGRLREIVAALLPSKLKAGGLSATVHGSKMERCAVPEEEANLRISRGPPHRVSRDEESAAAEGSHYHSLSQIFLSRRDRRRPERSARLWT